MRLGHGREGAVKRSGLRASTRCSWTPNAWAAAPPPAALEGVGGMAGFQRMATRETVGSASLRSSSCFPTSSRLA